MNYKFSNRVLNLKPSAIREIFKYAADPTYIPLSAGNPAPDAFPFEAIQEISRKLLDENPTAALQYSITEGYTPLRNHLSDYMSKNHNVGREKDDIIIASGAQQVVNLFSKAILNPGDAVLCEAPSFIGSLNTFRSYEAQLIGIPMDSDGVNLNRLEDVLKTEKNIKCFYTIPNFQNPSGITMSLEKRKAVYSLMKQYEVLILEDNPYGDLRFSGEDIPSIKSFDTEGIVIYAGSFSKVVSPGLRVGFAIGPKEILQKMTVCKQGEDVHSNIWAQIICHRFMTLYDYEKHLENLRSIYIRKSRVLLDAMNEHFTPVIEWNAFDGGLFAWCTLPSHFSLTEFTNKALEQKVCIVPGTAFLTDESLPCTSFRINFSTPSDAQLKEGVRILGNLAKNW